MITHATKNQHTQVIHKPFHRLLQKLLATNNTSQSRVCLVCPPGNRAAPAPPQASPTPLTTRDEPPKTTSGSTTTAPASTINGSTKKDEDEDDDEDTTSSSEESESESEDDSEPDNRASMTPAATTRHESAMARTDIGPLLARSAEARRGSKEDSPSTRQAPAMDPDTARACLDNETNRRLELKQQSKKRFIKKAAGRLAIGVLENLFG